MDAVQKVLDSQFLTVSAYSIDGGPYVQKFEKKLAKYCGVKHAVATNSGTSALETSLLALGIGFGDIVIVPSLTFVATANAVRSVGAKPIFCDVDAFGQLDYEKCRQAAKLAKPKAIILVDLYGTISEDAKKFHNLAPIVIEDSCQALGNPGAGTYGDVGCFSFYAAKVCTTMGNGGAVVTNDPDIAFRLKLKRNQGITVKGCITSGRNNIMNECHAAFGCVQLDKLPDFIKQRINNMRYLNLKTNNTNGYIGTLILGNRDKTKKVFHDAGIDAATYYDKPIHWHPYYQAKYSLLMTEFYANHVLNIPVHPNVTPEQLDLMKKLLYEIDLL